MPSTINSEKKKIYNKKYCESHKEEKRDYDKKYRENHKEQRRQYNKKYSKSHKEHVSQYHRKYYEKNKEHIKQHGKEYRENNKERVSQYHKKYYENNKERINLRVKKYQETHKAEHFVSARKARLKTAYGITLNQYNTLFDKQNGCCAVCGKHQSKLKRQLFVDHNHTTGKVRGLLCDKCNQAIGLLDDNSTLLFNATLYLERFSW